LPTILKWATPVVTGFFPALEEGKKLMSKQEPPKAFYHPKFPDDGIEIWLSRGSTHDHSNPRSVNSFAKRNSTDKWLIHNRTWDYRECTFFRTP
jgi:hypothetical protein